MRFSRCKAALSKAYLDILCAGDSHERAEVVQHQMEDGKLDRLRRRLEEIHKEELEDGNDTAGVA